MTSSRTFLLAAVAVAVALLAIAANGAFASAQPPVQTHVVSVPDGNGGSQDLEIKLTQESTRSPASPPRPPHAQTDSGNAAPGEVAGDENLPTATLLSPLMSKRGRPDAVSAAAPLLSRSNPVPMPYIFPASAIGSAKLAAGSGTSQLPCGGVVPCNGSPTWLVESQPGARIVDQFQKGCDCLKHKHRRGCDCKRRGPVSVTEEIGQRLDDIKNEIVRRAQILQADKSWIKQVGAVVKHYEKKIEAVKNNDSKLKGEIRKLFSKKQKYENMLEKIQRGGEQYRQLAQKSMMKSHAQGESVSK